MFLYYAYCNAITVLAHSAYFNAVRVSEMCVTGRLEQPEIQTLNHREAFPTMFTANDFLNNSNESVLDDKYNLIPEGEYTAQVGTEEDSIEVKTGEKDGKPWAQAMVKLAIVDPDGKVKEVLKREPRITYRFFIDLTDDGKLDQSPQRNVKLGALLKAANLARPGWKMTDLKGKAVKVRIASVKSDMNPGEKRSEVVQFGIAA